MKAKKSTDEEPYENVTLEDIAEELNSQLENPNTTLLFDGLPEIGVILPEEPTEGVDKIELFVKTFYEKILKPIGLPYIYLKLETPEELLETRLRKIRLELQEDEEMTEEHKAPLVESLQVFQHLNNFLEHAQD